MDDHPHHRTLNYKAPTTPVSPPEPKTFELSSARSGDDRAVTLIKWAVIVLAIAYAIFLLVRYLKHPNEFNS